MDFANKPMVVHQIEALRDAGVSEVVLAINYQPQVKTRCKRTSLVATRTSSPSIVTHGCAACRSRDDVCVEKDSIFLEI